VADNPTIDNGDLTDFVVASDDIGGAQHQYVKLEFGGDGTATKVETAAPLPVTLASAGTATPVTQSGTWTVQPGNTANTTAWKVDGSAVTQPVSGTITVGSVPAAARTIDSISAALATDRIMNNLTAVTPVFASLSVASNGNNTVVAAAGASNKIRVHQAFLVATSAVTVQWQSGASGTNLTGAASLAANSGYVLPFSPIGWFETAANTLLNLSLGGAVQVSGSIVYTVVT
jgi:hypothetical protein